MRIRAARPEDVPGIVDLWRDLLAHHRELGEDDIRMGPARKEGTPFIREHIGGKERLCLVAEADGGCVGFLVGTLRRRSRAFGGWRYGHIYDVYVGPDHRRSRVGTALVEEALAWFRRQGAKRVQLQVRARNREATEFWRALGFGDLALTMERRI